jgi:hypothetical protein
VGRRGGMVRHGQSFKGLLGRELGRVCHTRNLFCSGIVFRTRGLISAALVHYATDSEKPQPYPMTRPQPYGRDRLTASPDCSTGSALPASKQWITHRAPGKLDGLNGDKRKGLHLLLSHRRLVDFDRRHSGLSDSRRLSACGRTRGPFYASMNLCCKHRSIRPSLCQGLVKIAARSTNALWRQSVST